MLTVSRSAVIIVLVLGVVIAVLLRHNNTTDGATAVPGTATPAVLDAARQEMASETLWERAGWASVFRASSWRPRFMVGRFDIDETTRPLASVLSAGGLTYPSPSVDEGRWRNRCRFAHEGMCAVSWDGRVAPCLSLLHAHTEYVNAQTRRVHEHVVGHIDEQPLWAIWETASFQEFRQRVRLFDFPPCFHCGGCPLTETNDEDCYRSPAPVCGECLWAQGIVLCP